MTQILLHKPLVELQRQWRVVMEWPWVWWETRVYPNADGNILLQNFDGLIDRFTAFRYTFGHDGDSVVITDPPSVHLLQVLPDIPDIRGLPDVVHTETSTPRYMTVRMVWHEPPGELETAEGGLLTYGAWRPLAARTCMIGDYRVDTVRSRDVQELTDPRPMMFPQQLPPLQWSETPTIRNGEIAQPRRLGYVVPSAYDFMIPRYRAITAPVKTAKHRIKPKEVTPLPRSGKRTIDGINDDEIIRRIDELIDDELQDGETGRDQVRRAGPPAITD